MRYWHFTKSPDFLVDVGFQPRSRIFGAPSPTPLLWVTDDPWAWYRAWAEPQGYGYVAEVEVPPGVRMRTRHDPPDPPEIAIFDLHQVRVLSVKSVREAMFSWPASPWRDVVVETEDWQKHSVLAQWASRRRT